MLAFQPQVNAGILAPYFIASVRKKPTMVKLF